MSWAQVCKEIPCYFMWVLNFINFSLQNFKASQRVALILNSVPLIPLLFNVAFVSFSKGLMNTDSANKTNRSGETSNAEGSKGQIISEYFFYQQKFSTNFCPKGGFFSESEIRFSNIPISQNNYSKNLFWAWNLNKLFTDAGRNFKFQDQSM